MQSKMDADLAADHQFLFSFGVLWNCQGPDRSVLFTCRIHTSGTLHWRPLKLSESRNEGSIDTARIKNQKHWENFSVAYKVRVFGTWNKIIAIFLWS